MNPPNFAPITSDQLQQLEAIAQSLPLEAAQEFSEDCRINGVTMVNPGYACATYYLCGVEALNLAISHFKSALNSGRLRQ